MHICAVVFYILVLFQATTQGKRNCSYTVSGMFTFRPLKCPLAIGNIKSQLRTNWHQSWWAYSRSPNISS
jgi:hypothetical protein